MPDHEDEAGDIEEVKAWAAGLQALHARIAGRFGRAEPRRRALAYPRGLLGNVGRKNGWELAEHAGERTPDGMQRLLATVPTGDFRVAPQYGDFLNLTEVLAVLGKLRCSMYDNALIPIALANRLVSLSEFPSTRILETFARQGISA